MTNMTAWISRHYFCPNMISRCILLLTNWRGMRNSTYHIIVTAISKFQLRLWKTKHQPIHERWIESKE